MASVSEGEAAGDRRGRFLELLMGATPERVPFSFLPIFVGLMGPRRGDPGEEDPPPSAAGAADRIVLVNPLTQGMVVLRSGGGTNLAAMVQELMLGAGGEAPRGPPPASRASIEAMRTVERPSGDGGAGGVEEECAVCLDGLWAPDGEVGVGEKGAAAVKEMPCRHRFHGACIEKWLEMHGSCPVCRYRMPEEELPAGKKSGEEREEGGEWGGRRAAEREIWVTFGFSRRTAEGAQQQQQQQERQQQQQQEVEESE